MTKTDPQIRDLADDDLDRITGATDYTYDRYGNMTSTTRDATIWPGGDTGGFFYCSNSETV